MVSLPKLIGVVFCGLLFTLGLSTVAQTEIFDRRQAGQEAGKKQMHEMEAKTIQGKVLRVEGIDCFIKGEDGKEMWLHMDITTLKARNIEPGERIEAKVDDQNHVIAILSEPEVIDRRNNKE